MKEHHKHLSDVVGGVRAFFEQVFNKVEITAPEGLGSMLKDASVMITSSHRSQADYFLLGSTLHFMGVDNLRFAAGDNLTSLPLLGRRFQDWGAFTVERDRSNNRSYIVDLCEKTASMLQQNDNIIVFPEMGRSYKGNMLEVKQVIISAAILAQARLPKRKVVYLPCAMSYEVLPELAWFGVLQRGKRLRKPGNSAIRKMVGSVMYFGADIAAFSKFFAARRLGIKYGNVYVDIGAPVSVNEIVDLQKDCNLGAQGDFWTYRPAARKISLDLFTRLQSLYRILPAHLTAGAITAGAKTQSEVAASMERILARLRETGRNLRSVDGRDVSALVDEGIGRLTAARAITRRGENLCTRDNAIVDYYAAALR